jgi:hypothetical protein
MVYPHIPMPSEHPTERGLKQIKQTAIISNSEEVGFSKREQEIRSKGGISHNANRGE